eukprot:SAG31_NODE_4_length_45662_cov_15.654622_6_plen_69_part_00
MVGKSAAGAAGAEGGGGGGGGGGAGGAGGGGGGGGGGATEGHSSSRCLKPGGPPAPGRAGASRDRSYG